MLKKTKSKTQNSKQNESSKKKYEYINRNNEQKKYIYEN